MRLKCGNVVLIRNKRSPDNDGFRREYIVILHIIENGIGIIGRNLFLEKLYVFMRSDDKKEDFFCKCGIFHRKEWLPVQNTPECPIIHAMEGLVEVIHDSDDLLKIPSFLMHPAHPEHKNPKDKNSAENQHNYWKVVHEWHCNSIALSSLSTFLHVSLLTSRAQGTFSQHVESNPGIRICSIPPRTTHALSYTPQYRHPCAGCKPTIAETSNKNLRGWRQCIFSYRATSLSGTTHRYYPDVHLER